MLSMICKYLNISYVCTVKPGIVNVSEKIEKMLNGVFFSSLAGETLIQKQLLSSTVKWQPELFAGWLKKCNVGPPKCAVHNGMHYIHIRSGKVYIVVVTDSSNASPFVIVDYLHRLSEILTDLLGTPTPESLLDNIGLVYELLSESTCAGFPKLTDTTKLKPFLSSTVTQPNKSDDLLSLLPDNLFGIAEKEKREIPSQSSKKPLLNNKIETQKNEVYIDLIETLSVIFDASGNLMLCNIIGKLNVKSYLSGDANMTISFNQPNGELSQAITHSSVNKSNLPQDIKMQVSPGNFHALSYNLSNIGESVSMPFTLYSSIMPYPQDKMLTLSLKIHCDLPVRHPAMNLVGKIAIPECAVSASGISSLVNITFNHDRKRSEYCFSCPLFPGNSHHTVTVKLILSSWTAAMVFELDKVLLQFEAPMMCHSELKITGLKVQSVNTSSLPINKWVRYLTFANSYEFYLKDDWFPHTEVI